MLWDTLVPPGPWVRADFRSGPGGGYAAATPATDGNMVYCAFGSSVLAALDFQGDIVWRKEILPYTFDVTLGSSPTTTDTPGQAPGKPKKQKAGKNRLF